MVLVIVAIVCCIRTPVGQVSVLSSSVDVVRVSVLVTDRGRAVQGLQKPDFEVRDNGVVQDIELAGLEPEGVNVVLGFDVSASVSGERLGHLKTAGHMLLDQLSQHDRAALVTFNHVVRIEHPLTGDVSRVRRTLEAVTASGKTALVDGTFSAIATAGADAGRNLVILFSDRVDTASWLAPNVVLESVRRSDAVVYSVTVRGRNRPTFLRDISEMTGGSVIEIESSQDLSGVFLRILEEYRQRYLLVYVPRGVSPAGWHRIEVRVRGRGVTVHARPGYQGFSALTGSQSHLEPVPVTSPKK